MNHIVNQIMLTLALLGGISLCQADSLLGAQIAYQQASQAAEKAQQQLANTQQSVTFAEQKLAGAQRDYNQALEAKQAAEANVSSTQATLQQATDNLNQAWQTSHSTSQ